MHTVNSNTDAIIDSTANNNVDANTADTDPSVPSTNNTPAPTPTVILMVPEPESSTLLYVTIVVMVILFAIIVSLAITIVIIYHKTGSHANTAGTLLWYSQVGLGTSAGQRRHMFPNIHI